MAASVVPSRKPPRPLTEASAPPLLALQGSPLVFPVLYRLQGQHLPGLGLGRDAPSENKQPARPGPALCLTCTRRMGTDSAFVGLSTVGVGEGGTLQKPRPRCPHPLAVTCVHMGPVFPEVAGSAGHPPCKAPGPQPPPPVAGPQLRVRPRPEGRSQEARRAQMSPGEVGTQDGRNPRGWGLWPLTSTLLSDLLLGVAAF